MTPQTIIDRVTDVQIATQRAYEIDTAHYFGVLISVAGRLGSAIKPHDLVSPRLTEEQRIVAQVSILSVTHGTEHLGVLFSLIDGVPPEEIIEYIEEAQEHLTPLAS